MSNDWWSYESKDTYRAKQAQDWATKASKDAFSYLAPTTTGVPPEALQQDPNSAFAPKPLITPQDDQGSSSGGFFKGIESGIGDIGKTAYDLTLKPINRVLEAEHNAIARPIAQTLLSPFGDYNKLPGIVRLGAETLTDPLTYIGPGEVMDAFKVAKLAPELKLGAPALQALFDSPGSRRLLTHIVTSGGLGLAAVGGNSAAQALGLKGLPAMAAGLGAAAIAGHAIGGSEAEVANAIKPSSADDLRTSMEQAWSKGRQSGHIDASMEANAKRLDSYGSPDDLVQRMYDQTEMLQLKKKIDSGSATDADLDRAGELVAKADAYKQADSLPKIGGGAAGSTEAMQTIIDRYNSADPKVQQLVNATSDIEVKANQQARAGWTVGARDAMGNFMESSTYGTNLSNYLKSQGLRLHDTDATAYINEAGRIKNGLGNGYSAAMADNAETILKKANDDKSLPTSYVKENGTVVNDEDLTNQAHLAQAVNGTKLLNPDGSLSLHTIVNNPESFKLNPVQQATVSALTAPMSLQHGLERVFGVEDNGPLAHVEPLSEKGNVSNGVNAQQNYQRPQGDLAGAKGYLPYADAQAARVQQGYHKISDSWLNATLEGMGKTASQLVPSELVDSINNSKTIRDQINDVRKRLQAAIDNKTKSTGKDAWKETAWKSPDYEVVPELKDITRGAQSIATNFLPTGTTREAGYQALMGKLNELEAPFSAMSDKQSAIMDEIRSGRGSQFRADYPVEFQGKYYPQDLGEQLNRYNQSVSPTGITKAVIDTNNLVRPIMATLDASFMGVQGLVAALSNPMSYMTALKTLVTNGYGDYENTIRNSGRLSSMLNDGVHWAARNDAGEYLFPSAISKIPGIGKMADNSNTWFTQFGNVLRSELYNSVNWQDMTDVKRAGLARTVNLMTGFSPNNPTNLESAVSFAPRFFRSQMGLLADAVTKHDMGPMGAARSMSTMLASGVALTYAMNESLGQKTDFNPESPNFLRVRVGGQDVAIFGTWDTLARAVTKTYQTGNPLAGPEYLARAKASPVMSKVYDVITGSTLQGNKLKWGTPGDILSSAAVEAKTILPISATQIASDVAKDPTQLANPSFVGGQALQFLGTKATPLSPAENMQIKRDTLSQQNFGKPWSQLEPYQQLQLHENNNVDLTPKSDLAKAFAFRRDISSQYQGEQESIDSQLPVGKDWIDAYHNLQREKIGGFAQWNKEHPDAAAQISVGKPKNANDAALQKFYQLFDQADKESWSPDELTQNVSDFQDSISPDQQAYIDRNTGLHDTARVKDYKADQKILRPYWDIADTVYDRLKGRLPDADSASSLQDYTSQLIGKMQAAGVPDQVIAQRVKTNPVLSEITRATGALRQRYRQTHPQADKLLSKWYGYSQVAT